MEKYYLIDLQNLDDKEANNVPVTFEDLKDTLKMTLSAEKESLDDFELTKVITEREDKGLTEDKIDSGDIDYITKYLKEFEYDVKPVEESQNIKFELKVDADDSDVTVGEQKEQAKESYVEDAEGEYTVWSASDLVKPEDQIPLVKIKTDEEGNLYAEAVGETELDKESLKIAQSVLDTAKKSGKSTKDTLVRLDKTLNHNDPFFSVEFDRNITNTGYELLAAQTLRTMRDDLKAYARGKNATELGVVDKYEEFTGVDYYTDTVKDKEQYDHILKLQGIKPDIYEYEKPDENKYMIQFKNLAEDLIEKIILRNDPDFYNR